MSIWPEDDRSFGKNIESNDVTEVGCGSWTGASHSETK
jgi:hypothetical protein